VSDWLEILLLAVASAFWPTLILVVVVALRLEHPTVLAPKRTILATNASNAWLSRNGHRIAAGVLAIVGLYLVARGLIKL